MKAQHKVLLVSALGVAFAFYVLLKYGPLVRALVPDMSDRVFGTLAALSLFGMEFGFAGLVLGGRRLWRMPDTSAPRLASNILASNIEEQAMLNEERRLRVAELRADPARRKYAELVEKGHQWTDEQIAYDMDATKTTTCDHLRRMEHEMRVSGIVPKVIVKPWLGPAPSLNIRADCCINEPEVRQRYGLSESIRYQEGYMPERHPQDNPWATLSCPTCDSAMELVHREWPRKDTRWFPSKPDTQ
jgi:hypothetical protein